MLRINLFASFVPATDAKEQCCARGNQSQHARLRNGCDSQIIVANIAAIARIVIEHIYASKRSAKCAAPTV